MPPVSLAIEASSVSFRSAWVRSRSGTRTWMYRLKRLFVAAGNRQCELVGAFLHYGRLADVHAGFVGFGGEFDGFGRAVGPQELAR